MKKMEMISYLIAECDRHYSDQKAEKQLKFSQTITIEQQKRKCVENRYYRSGPQWNAVKKRTVRIKFC